MIKIKKRKKFKKIKLNLKSLTVYPLKKIFMIIIGITGSIGMGKTTVSNMLRFLKIPVFDSDQQVRKILEVMHLSSF